MVNQQRMRNQEKISKGEEGQKRNKERKKREKYNFDSISHTNPITRLFIYTTIVQLNYLIPFFRQTNIYNNLPSNLINLLTNLTNFLQN